MTRRVSPSSCRGCRSQPTFSSVPRNQRVSNNLYLLIISDTVSFIYVVSLLIVYIYLFFLYRGSRVLWGAADVGVSDFHHVRPGDVASWSAPASQPHPATTGPVLQPELPQRQRAHRSEHCCQYHSPQSVLFLECCWQF